MKLIYPIVLLEGFTLKGYLLQNLINKRNTHNHFASSKRMKICPTPGGCFRPDLSGITLRALPGTAPNMVKYYLMK